jgi:hypothetical protein
MRPLSLEQSDTMNRNKTENETTKTRTIRCNKTENEPPKIRTIRYIEQQKKTKMKPLKLEQSDTTNSKKT